MINESFAIEGKLNDKYRSMTRNELNELNLDF